MAHTFTTTAVASSTDDVTEIPNTTLASLATSPRKVVTDEGSVEERDARELIALDQHLANQAVTDKPLHGLRISKFKPSGAV